MSSENKEDGVPWKPSGIEQPTNIMSKMPVRKIIEEYNMKHKERGHAYIFCNEYTNEIYQLTPKDYTYDCEALSATLRNLRFTVSCFKDYTASQIITELEELAAMNHSDCDCVLVAMLALGGNGLLFGSDKGFKLNEIFKKFSADLVISLAEKPKIFIIEASRGFKLDNGFSIFNKNRIEHDVLTEQNQIKFYKIPKHADFLIAYSTQPDYYSVVNRVTGSPFIQSLCEQLNENRNNYHFLILLSFVCQNVSFDESSDDKKEQQKQTPCTNSTLTRLLKFN